MNIVITGSIAFDYIMKFPGYFKDHILPDKLDSISLSFLVESMTKQRGGVAPNIAYTMALLGGRPLVMATAGKDFEEYRGWLDSVGVDTSAVKIIADDYTASFFANFDRANAQLASFYAGAMARAREVSLRDLAQKPDLAVISPNDPGAMGQYVEECLALGIPYAYDVSWQLARLSPDEIETGVRGCHMLLVNDYEMGLITSKTGIAEGDARLADTIVVVTRGENGATIYAGGDRCDIPVVPLSRESEPTGAGDAFRGGLLRGWEARWPWAVCGRMGALAATYCLESRGPQNHSYTRPEFVARYRQHFDDDGLLDELLN
ncbi:MAG: carbohydrate kinase family protein [Chloroflexi bacterium]|nr:carbohydrate kinase family protein [Chloroflexota bacterium]